MNEEQKKKVYQRKIQSKIFEMENKDNMANTNPIIKYANIRTIYQNKYFQKIKRQFIKLDK